MIVAPGRLSWLFVGVVFAAFPAYGGIVDFTEWDKIVDPFDANFSGSVDTASQITLSASGGPVPHATDIGYISVDGNTAASSTSGYAFDPAADFSVAVDFTLSLDSAVGGLGIGFGIGEDRDGANSAGVALLTTNGFALAPFTAVARVNDVNQPLDTVLAAQTSGRLIVSYTAAGGDVQVGVSTDGDEVPEGISTFAGIQNSWNDELLIPSFFMRSDGTLGSAWTSGTAEAVFSDFHVIEGTPVVLPVTIPEPSSLCLLGFAMPILLYRRFRA